MATIHGSVRKVHAAHILDGLRSVRHLTNLCDGAVKLSDCTININRVLLAAASPYFSALYGFDCGHQESRSIDIPTLESICKLTFDSILDYIYTGHIALNCDNIQDILQASDLLLMQDLKDVCIEYLLTGMDVENCLGIYQFAQLFSCPRLEFEAKNFFCTNFSWVSHTEEFANLCQQRLLELLALDCLEVKSEEEVERALQRWIEANSEKISLAQMLRSQCIRTCRNFKDNSNAHLTERSPVKDIIGSESERGSMNVLVAIDISSSLTLIDVQQIYGGNVWLPAVPLSVTSAAVVAEGGFLFVIGGKNKIDGSASCDVARYDFSLNKWTLMTSMPIAEVAPHVLAVSGNIYVVARFPPGGQQGKGGNSFQTYNIYTNRWRQLSPVPFRRMEHTVALVQEKIYVIGGNYTPSSSDITPTSAVEIFSIRDEIWIAGPPLQEKRGGAVSVGIDDTLYVIGGVRPTLCPSNHGALRMMPAEALVPSKQNTWINLPGYYNPSTPMFIEKLVKFGSEVLVLAQTGGHGHAHTCYSINSCGWVQVKGGNEVLHEFDMVDFTVVNMPKCQFSTARLGGFVK